MFVVLGWDILVEGESDDGLFRNNILSPSAKKNGHRMFV